jgi:hypothetical protein
VLLQGSPSRRGRQDVLAVADAFTRATGYVLMDIKPGNITF